MYFVNPQPKGGKEVKNIYNELSHFLSGRISPEFRKFIIEEDDLISDVNMNVDEDSVVIRLDFKNGALLTESFSVEELFIDMVEEFGHEIVFKKGNIYCFNKSNEEGYYTVPLVFENDRSQNRLKFIDDPFVMDKEHWEDFEKALYKKIKIMNLERVNINDSTYTYALDPTWMGLRWLMKNMDGGDYLFGDYDVYLDDLIFVNAIEVYIERVETDSLKYKAIFDSLGISNVFNY